jgi:Sec-independent protein translocase protein TatA
MTDLASGIKSFRKGMSEEDDKTSIEDHDNKE